jgi:WD40 repeat protein
MNGTSLKVRCLASTRISESTCQEQESKEEVKGEVHDQEASEEFGIEHLPIRGGRNLQHVSYTEAQSDSTVDHCSDASSEESEDDSNDDLNEKSSDDSADSCSNASDDETSHDSGKKPSHATSSAEYDKNHTSCIQEAQLSPDGTCIFTSDFNRTFSVYPIAPTLKTSPTTLPLAPYAKFTSPDPIWAFATNPLFNLHDASSTHVLISRRDRYITLHNALWDLSIPSYTTTTPATPINISAPINSYKLINPLTEAVVAPLSLVYSSTGTHFFAGHANAIATFDLTYPDAPIHTIRTIPSANSKLKGGGRGFKGVVTALALDPTSALLAAGARTRHIGIYDSDTGREVTTMSLPGTLDGRKLSSATNTRNVIGDGVSSLKYSPCGSYLYVAERMSDALLIYDVRNFSLALAYCAGRKAVTKQRLGFDVWGDGGESHEVWAGGTDGNVRVWRDPWRKEGAVEADEVVCVGEGDGSVVGSLVHGSGGLAVTACGKMDTDGLGAKGKLRGGGRRPKFREWGSLEILGLS